MADSSLGNPGAVPFDDTDLSGMDPQAAREYVLAFIKSMKETQHQRQKKQESLKQWHDRIKLAEEHGRGELAEQARQKEAEVQEEVARLETEEQELGRKIRTLKENLKKVESSFSQSIDAESLQAELEMLTGQKDEVQEEFDRMKAAEDLEALRKKMKNQE
ncbi:MAG TPA: hypothetical protein VMX75_14840 [Spirochaetia bacterium]|nr:hypothetical protein [Spirochaetia bacterium]